MKPGFIAKCMGSNPEEEIMTDWTEKDGVFTLERDALAFEIRCRENISSDDQWLVTCRVSGLRSSALESFPSLEAAKSAVEEILSLLQPKAKELVWELSRSSEDFLINSGDYSVGNRSRELSPPNVYVAIYRGKIIAKKKSTPTAKAACQSHFDALVEGMME